ncbi:PPA1309 family protein [Corynebacterium pyruviciproducens]|uniref:PPA1309 family protein n=1 Tax=Corynebacterium pyruviciproducens TaxID=598660 RepID=UPI0023F48B1B|nr:PPA1309 family protein [Corynebacterium pyruviciproducens]
MEFSQQHLNRAVLEAIDFVHAEGWDAPPTLFALVPSRLLIDALPDPDLEEALSLVVQELPDNLPAGSPELGEYLTRIIWPDQVVGAVLAQEITFRDTSSDDPSPRPARLFSAVLRDEDLAQTILQLRSTEEGLFSDDDYELRGGPGIAPELISALQYSFTLGLDEDDDIYERDEDE